MPAGRSVEREYLGALPSPGPMSSGGTVVVFQAVESWLDSAEVHQPGIRKKIHSITQPKGKDAVTPKVIPRNLGKCDSHR